MIKYRVITAVDRKDLLDICDDIVQKQWPEFMLNDPVANAHWGALYVEFPEYQFALMEPDSDTIIAVANSIPFHFDDSLENLPDEGWDWVLKKGFNDKKAGLKANLQSALAITMAPGYLGNGLSAPVVMEMKKIGAAAGLKGMVAPVRPNKKPDYPLISIDSYIHWKREDGRLFDPWLSVHAKLGARIIKPCHRAMLIPGTCATWEKWTGLRFRETGSYIVPGALNPVVCDCEKDSVVYTEPNVWVYHDFSG